MNLLIIGCNGFIGSHLSEYIIDNTDWKVTGVDLYENNISGLTEQPNFVFMCLDITKNLQHLSEEIAKCDLVIPLAAIANPKIYIDDPLKVFELDFEANLFIVRECVRHGKRLIFPSTSEVYGLCEDEYFDEEASNLTLGPINKTRWIYSSSKQLLDRVIWAYKDEGLDFTIFRPFNWVGPRLDNIHSKKKESRVITQFLGNIMRQEPIELVSGGEQKRAFTDFRDGIDALVKIISNQADSNHKIVNIGNPENEFSVRQLALMLVSEFHEHEGLKHLVENIELKCVRPESFYGEGYQDVTRRVPNIEIMRSISGWTPRYQLSETVSLVMSYYLKKGTFDNHASN